MTTAKLHIIHSLTMLLSNLHIHKLYWQQLSATSQQNGAFAVPMIVWCLVEQLEMKDKYNQILIRYRPQLVDEIDGTELLNLLISKNVLTRRQVKSITVPYIAYLRLELLCALILFIQTLALYKSFTYYYLLTYCLCLCRVQTKERYLFFRLTLAKSKTVSEDI